ncbi:hypothetical protein ZOSMA_333G00030 [Zostera marina]|uniref:Uncharacterized protein n=1 Tax=Zostera marina TaxID=29655 RepID=A0A0K9PA95_ZOSMR|nr:hypothetical protein ZOSMA_333G00030 [Zostera marina]
MASGNDNQKLSTKHALVYLRNVKDVFHDYKEKYGEFLEVMKDFKAERTDTRGVIEQVRRALFKDHPDLILGFNDFLPHGYSIQSIATNPVDLEDKKPIEFEEAISFVNKIKVSVLFQSHQDLLDEFVHFLPDTSTLSSTFHSSSGRLFGHRDDRSSAKPAIFNRHINKKGDEIFNYREHDKKKRVDRENDRMEDH